MATAGSAAMRLFILGGTGGVGRQLVSEALRRGHRVTAFVRTPGKLAAPQEGLTVAAGDARDGNAIAAALGGHDAVLSAIGPRGLGASAITSDCARATVMAMRAVGVRRLVIVGVGMLFKGSGLPAFILRTTLLRNIASDSAAMETVVRASDLDWTIVRPPRLTNGARTARYVVADDRPPGGVWGNASLSRADLAHFVLHEVEQPGHTRRVVGIDRRSRKGR